MLQQLALAGMVLFAVVALDSHCGGGSISLYFRELMPCVPRIEGSACTESGIGR
jgi:hypothetical protein